MGVGHQKNAHVSWWIGCFLHVCILLIKLSCINKQPSFICDLCLLVVCNFKEWKWWVVVLCVKFQLQPLRNLKRYESESCIMFFKSLPTLHQKKDQHAIQTHTHTHKGTSFTILTRFVGIHVYSMSSSYVFHNSPIHDLVLIPNQHSGQSICKGITIYNTICKIWSHDVTLYNATCYIDIRYIHCHLPWTIGS